MLLCPPGGHPIKWEEIIMANEKILVVDDDTNICELLRLYLTKDWKSSIRSSPIWCCWT